MSFKVTNASILDLKHTGNVERFDWFHIIHALLMILAWLGSSGSGIMIAQHFKAILQNPIFGSGAWYRAHQFFMIFAVTSTIIALVVIFVKEELKPLEWSKIEQNPHPVFGLICLVLALLNPILAIFRPPPFGGKCRFLLGHFCGLEFFRNALFFNRKQMAFQRHSWRSGTCGLWIWPLSYILWV